jgi:hypothetical protein
MSKKPSSALHDSFVEGVCDGQPGLHMEIGCNPDPNYDKPPDAAELARRKAAMGDLSGGDPAANEAAAQAMRAARLRRLEDEGTMADRLRAISSGIRQGR